LLQGKMFSCILPAKGSEDFAENFLTVATFFVKYAPAGGWFPIPVRAKQVAG